MLRGMFLFYMLATHMLTRPLGLRAVPMAGSSCCTTLFYCLFLAKWLFLFWGDLTGEQS